MLRKHYNNNESPSAHKWHLAALFLLFLSLAACHTSTRNGQTGADSTAIRVGVLPTQECLKLFYAERMGMTDSLGLRLVVFRSVADIDTALLGGSVDIALTDTARLAYLQRDSIVASMLHVMANARDTLWLVATDSSNVRGAGGLKDKLVGMLRYSDAQTAANRLSQHAQYNEGDVFYIQVGDLTQRYKMLAARLLDAAFLPHPYSDAAIALGHRRIRLTVTDELNQGVWVATSSDSTRFAPLLKLINDTTRMQPDTVRAILQDTYLLPQQPLDSLQKAGKIIN